MGVVSFWVRIVHGATGVRGMEKDGIPLVDSKVGCTLLRSEIQISFLSSQLFKSEMKTFQNSSVYSRVPSYQQTLKKSQTCRLWNKPRVQTHPTNTLVVVNVSSFPYLDLPFRNDSKCLALECYLQPCFQKVVAAKESSKRGAGGKGVWAVILPVQSPAWPWGPALSHLCTYILAFWAPAPEVS